MKKVFTLLALCLAAKFTSAQIIPSLEVGVKGGVNLTKFSKTSAFDTDNRAGYLAGAWARVGGLGFNFQPELYITSKNVRVNNGELDAKFTSIDVPLLFGSKIGVMGVGGRFYTGPLVSFAINKDQNASQALGNVARLNYKDQNTAWVFGAGLDFQKLNFDLRYEYGLSKQPYNVNNDKTRVSLFNFSVGYRLWSL